MDQDHEPMTIWLSPRGIPGSPMFMLVHRRAICNWKKVRGESPLCFIKLFTTTLKLLAQSHLQAPTVKRHFGCYKSYFWKQASRSESKRWKENRSLAVVASRWDSAKYYLWSWWQTYRIKESEDTGHNFWIQLISIFLSPESRFIWSDLLYFLLLLHIANSFSLWFTSIIIIIITIIIIIIVIIIMSTSLSTHFNLQLMITSTCN